MHQTRTTNWHVGQIDLRKWSVMVEEDAALWLARCRSVREQICEISCENWRLLNSTFPHCQFQSRKVNREAKTIFKQINIAFLGWISLKFQNERKPKKEKA